MSGGYAAPKSVKEAVALLGKKGRARVLAGGQGLLVEPARSTLADTLLVDLGRIPGLAGIERQRDGSLAIGAMATVAAIAESADVRAAAPVLAAAAQASGDAQWRNRATLGGVLAGADPQADLPAVLLALGAGLEIAGKKSRTVALDGFYAGKSSDSEIITGVTVPAAAERSGVAYEKSVHPATLGALCGVAAAVTLAADGAIADARVAVTGATDRPGRAAAAEKALAGQRPGDDLLASAAAAAAGAGTALDDHFGSAEYRRHLTRVLTGRALRRAVAAASGGGR